MVHIISLKQKAYYQYKASITRFAPQGSILGPLLFLIYISDIPQYVDGELVLYADDTCLVFQYKDIKTIVEHLNRYFQLKLIGS